MIFRINKDIFLEKIKPFQGVYSLDCSICSRTHWFNNFDPYTRNLSSSFLCSHMKSLSEPEHALIKLYVSASLDLDL